MALQKSVIAMMLLGVSVLTACSIPNSMPRGYVYHNDAFKSPNPPVSPKFTKAQRQTMGLEQANQFRLAVYSLAESLTVRAGIPPKPIYVLRPDTMTPFYANMDNDLQESLRHLGYTLSDTPDNAYIMTYNAQVIKEAKGSDSGNKPLQTVEISSEQNNSEPNVQIGIYVHDKAGEDSRVLTKEEGAFYVRGADVMSIPFATFGNVLIPDFSGSSEPRTTMPTKE